MGLTDGGAEVAIVEGGRDVELQFFALIEDKVAAIINTQVESRLVVPSSLGITEHQITKSAR